ncbi:MAG: hypothetical protein E4H38_04485, partial [Gemmatimonadales bacterium]
MNRRGSALLVSLVVLVALAILGVAALELADRRMEAGRREMARVRIQAVGRSALARAIARLIPDSALSLAPGEVGQLDSTVPLPGMVIVDSLTRLSFSLFQVSGTAWLTRPGGALEARDATRELIELIELQVAETVAVVTPGPLRVEGTAQVSGIDLAVATIPSCSTAARPGSAASVPATARVWVDSSSGAGMTGAPVLVLDSSISAGFLDRLPPSPLPVLAGAAVHSPFGGRLAPGPSFLGSSCDPSDALNWGDPASSAALCAAYRPIIR